MALIQWTQSGETQTLSELQSHLRIIFVHLQSAVDAIKGLVWRNPYGIAPSRVLELLQTDAGSLDAVLKQAITLHDAVMCDAKIIDAPIAAITAWVPEDKVVTVKEDGTATVADKVEAVK